MTGSSWYKIVDLGEDSGICRSIILRDKSKLAIGIGLTMVRSTARKYVTVVCTQQMIANVCSICYLQSGYVMNLRKSPRQKKVTTYYKPTMGPDGKWKEDSPFKWFDVDVDNLKDVGEHKTFLNDKKRDCNQSVVFIQRHIIGFNKLIRDLGNCNKHRIGINRVAHMAKSMLELLEELQEGWKGTLGAYEDSIKNYEDLKKKYDDVVRHLEDLEVDAIARGANPSQGEADGWSPQRNVNLDTRFVHGPDGVAVAVVALGGGEDSAANEDGDGKGNDMDDDSDRTTPMTPSPVKSVRTKKSKSPAY